MASPPLPRLLVLIGLPVLASCAAFERARDPSAPEGPDWLVEYRESSYRAQGTELGDATGTDELLTAARTTGMLLLGDLHQDVMLHALHRSLIARLNEQDTPVVLVLEALASQDDEHTTAYLNDELTIEELRERIASRWPRSWLEPSRSWDYLAWRSMLRTAKANEWPVYGLEEAPRRPLLERDELIAMNLRSLRSRHPDRLVVAILGQAHLAGEGTVGDRLADDAVRVLVRPSTALEEAASDEESEKPFSNLPALGQRAFLLRPSRF
ncbi:MAG: ChaN family lipoprotein [Planctomycetota bacterium]